MLEFFKVFPKLLLIPQTLRTNAAKRQILGWAQLVIFAVATSKIFAASSATLKKNNFSVKDAVDYVHQVLNVVVTFDRVEALLTIVTQPRVYKEHELFFFNPWKLECFLIQNHHDCLEPVHFN
jgi:hypothetical protein